ncbi:MULTISPECIES: amino acid carrier protein [unclassified Actinomyces]|uniref:alanine/glycine:cation symporter family protein n=1 Tax=unclassified Actinomyces TaxID=2609248 RepID=UPI00201744E9|nr:MULTISPECIES: amino acid carrier protein [unclassified Actinomyces]MCL3776742.1 sodium:alanine symporter family protein [Actinomyces sp. AC-20-1]MCL3789696.1 sodium:alanine symporter family protein [Actinomyces sp. 187325]MCL3791881.1 sodium:alanine symporter family protein [Actinomyces sp. 186855]MCL3794458.1 sodium:alanine symporter family protein [Actinomyces sp. 217892]
MALLNDVLGTLSNWLFGTVLVWLLIGAGLLLTLRTRGVQLRHLGAVLRSVAGSRSGAEGGISSFQAFAVGLACRVGTGNIVGVALALVLGGPGAVFWMWVVALVGTATAFTEATLGQMFKVRRGDGSYRGGPAYYIAHGLGLPAVGAVFAVLFMVANGLAMPMVQANAMTAALGASVSSTLGASVSPWVWAALVAALVAPVLLGGLRSIARVTELLAPLMAGVYLVLVAAIILTHPAQTLTALGEIVSGALGLRPGLAGVAGGVTVVVLNGVRRGLFSNEAGLGGAACAAGSATVRHPVQQGLIQSFGVLVDTLLICTATALAILVAGAEDPAVYQAGVTGADGADLSGTLTQTAIASVLGGWTSWPMTVLVLVLAYSTILGAFSYAEVSLDYLTRAPWVTTALRLGAVACAFIGGGTALTTVWTLADVLLGLGAVINLVALALLARWAVGALRDWEAQRRALAAGTAPGLRFVATANPHLPGELPGDVWAQAPARR